MTGINQIYPYAVDDGANVLPNANYQAASARLAGVVAGTASSALANTAWRQSSVIAAALAQFVVDNTGLSVLDDGDVTGFETKFRSALASLLVTSNPPLYTGQDTSNNNAQITATITPALAGYVPGLYVIETNTTPSGAVQASFNGLPNAQVVKSGGQPLSGNEWRAGDTIVLTWNGSQLVLANDNSVAATITLNVPAQYPTINAALVAASQLLIASNAYVNIALASGTYSLTSSTGPIYISLACGQRVSIVGPALNGAFPVKSDILGKSNSQILAFLETRFNAVVTCVGTDAVQVRSAFHSIQNVLFSGDGTTSGGHYGAKVADATTEVAGATIAFMNCWFHGFGLANLRIEGDGFVQGNNLGLTCSNALGAWVVVSGKLEINSGNFLSMYNTGSGILLSNQGLFALPNNSGAITISNNAVHGIAGQEFASIDAISTTSLDIENNGQYGVYMSNFCSASLAGNGSTVFGGNGSGDCLAQIDSFIATYGCGLPGGSSPSRGGGGGNTQSFVY